MTHKARVENAMREFFDKNATESDEQRILAQWLDALGLSWLHLPNERSNLRELGRLKAEGLKAGAPDNLIFSAPAAWSIVAFAELERTREMYEHTAKEPRGIAIELKRPSHREKPTGEQLAWGVNLMRHGWLWSVCYGADEAMALMRSWGFP